MMIRQLKSIQEVEEKLINLVGEREDRLALPIEAGLRRSTSDLDLQIRLLMWVMRIKPDWFDDVVKGSLRCDKCDRPFLACLAQVSLEDMVICENCKYEEDPMIAMHEIEEVMDHRTDEVTCRIGVGSMTKLEMIKKMANFPDDMEMVIIVDEPNNPPYKIIDVVPNDFSEVDRIGILTKMEEV